MAFQEAYGALWARWVYLDAKPCIETFDVANRQHSLTSYIGA